jgi:hypothetical protein
MSSPADQPKPRGPRPGPSPYESFAAERDAGHDERWVTVAETDSVTGRFVWQQGQESRFEPLPEVPTRARVQEDC